MIMPGFLPEKPGPAHVAVQADCTQKESACKVDQDEYVLETLQLLS